MEQIKPFAVGSITILDLVDDATYIYYAKDVKGTGASISPFSGAEYVGFYNGDALVAGQPAPGSSAYNTIYGSIKWTKYIGPRGEKGETGNGISSTVIEYAIGESGVSHPTSGWSSTIPQTDLQKPYLWTKTTMTFDDGTSKISYSVSSSIDGIQIGGRNLFLKSHYKKFSALTGIIHFIEHEDSLEIVCDSMDGTYTTFSIRISNLISEKDNYTLSFDCKTTLETGITADFCDNIIQKNYTVSASEKYTRLVFSGEGDPRENQSIYNFVDLTFSQKEPFSIFIRKVKFERGNKATDWTPAPEDVQTEIDNGTYWFETKEEEITKISREEEVIFIPGQIKFTITKKTNGQREKVKNCSVDPFLIWNGEKIALPRNYLTSNVEGFNYDLSAFVDSQDDQFANEKSIIKEENCAISFDIKDDKGQLVLIKTMICQFGTSEDLAKFSINAADINAAIKNTKLKFDIDGLHIKNGGFDIVNSSLEKVLFADSEGNLHIKGQLEGASGIFRGKLEAASGSFDGNVTCSSGRIGGFEINEDSFQSIQKRGDGITSTLVLDGQNGFIEAERSILHSLELKKQIDIGDTICIKTPTNNEEAFLSVRDQNGIPVLSAKKKGTIQIGSDKNHVLLDGGNSCIYAGESPMNYNWKISPEEAIFNNIVAKGSIKASVFEYGSVQSLGGILVVRPSTQVKKIKDLPIDDINYKKVIYVNSCNGFNVGDWCIFQTEQQGLFQEVYQITEIDPQNNCITFNEQLNQFISNMPLINLGKNGSIGIGLNATGDSSFIPRNAMSVFSFSFTDSNHYRLSPKIILGEMTGENGENTFGLYAEGVKLKGSLITDTSNGKNEYGYAGINTSGQEVPFSSLYADKFNNEPSPILIWAGATGSSKEEIEKANFFVDRNGNLYANSGFFNGTIITNSSIVASEIKTATIIGDNKKTDQPALTIKDTKKGILFTNENGEKILEVTDDNITMRASSINFNDHFVITEKGMPLLSHLYIGQNIKGSSSLGIKDNKIICIPKDENNIIGNSEAGYISIKDTIDFSANGSKKDLSITNNLIEVCSNINFNEKILYYNKQTYFNPVYNKENNFVGYDFYITEKEQ